MKVHFKPTPLYREPDAEPMVVAAPPAVSADEPPRRRHAIGRAAAMVGAGAVLWGCAQTPTTPPPQAVRVLPTTVAEGTGSSVAAGYLALARRYEKEARYAQAGDAYNMALETGNDDPQVLDAVGVALAGHGQVHRAIKALRRAVALSPTSAAILNNLGYALQMSGQEAEATAYYRLALTIDPAHQRAAENLARLAPPAPVAVAAAPALPQTPTPSVPVPDTVAVAPQPVAAAAPAAKPLVTTTPKADAPARRIAGVRIEYVNANGGTGVAQRMRRYLRDQGVAGGAVANRRKFSAVTVVEYRAGREDLARELAGRMPWAVTMAAAPGTRMRADLRVVIGRDARLAPHCEALKVCRPGSQQVIAGTATTPTP